MSSWDFRRLALAAVAWALCSCSAEPTAKPAELKVAAEECMSSKDLKCAEESWRAYVKARPTDASAIANLGIVQNQRDEHEDAVVQFKKAIDLGEGTYDLFAYYADSLTKLGRIDDAIDWSYKSLTLVPTLVDVRGNLAKLLVLRKRHYEALTLLASFDDHLVSIGQSPYFEGQKIAIESAAQETLPASSAEQHELRLPKFGDHFFAPVVLGSQRVAAFLVDTGASNTSMNEAFLANAKATYQVIHPRIDIELADHHHVNGRLINIDSMRLGQFVMKNVNAVTCERCALLLGQQTLSQYDMKSSKIQGVEFLTLRQR